MSRIHTYYLGHVIKIGQLDAEKIYDAIKVPKPFYWYGAGWSFFDAEVGEQNGISYISGRLSKFDPRGEIVISDPQTSRESVQPEPNIRLASSHFVYIPSMSGISFSKALPDIDEFNFSHRFASIIRNTHDDFFIDCDIALIADLQSFADRLIELDGIFRIAVNLKPPNPIYGPLWKPLRDYVRKRRSDKMLIREEAQGDQPLNTDLPKIVEAVARQDKNNAYAPDEELPIGDAAILMAADGYGTAHIKGRKDGETVIIKVAETSRNFSYDDEPSNEQLFRDTYAIMKEIEDERHLEH